MSHPLIDRLHSEFGYARIDEQNHGEFVAAAGMNVLFFPGNPDTVRDATDVAVILPELVTSFDGRLRVGVVHGQRGAAASLQKRYGFKTYPSLVFIRDGEYVGTISRVQNWTDYLEEIAGLFTAPPRRAPGFSIPVVTA